MKKIVLFIILSLGSIFLADLALAKVLAPESKLITKKQTIINSKLFYTIKMAYPELITKNNDDKKTQFNSTVKNTLDNIKKNFIVNIPSSNETDRKNSPSSFEDNQLTISYAVINNSSSFISIRFNYYPFFHGAAHPSQYFSTINYDLKQNKLITWNDLFKPQSDFLRVIALYCKQDLLKQKNVSANDWLAFSITDGTKPVLKNYQHWNLTPKGILINFETDQVASYAEGPQSVLVPYSAIKSLLNQNSIIGRLLH